MRARNGADAYGSGEERILIISFADVWCDASTDSSTVLPFNKCIATVFDAVNIGFAVGSFNGLELSSFVRATQNGLLYPMKAVHPSSIACFPSLAAQSQARENVSVPFKRFTDEASMASVFW